MFRLGVDPRVVSSANGHTLLHAACGFGASKIAKLVVRRAVYESHPPFRAFLDARANDGSAALDVATNAGFERIAEWLTALGASSGFRRAAFEAPSLASVSYEPYANDTRSMNANDPRSLYPPAFYPPAFAPAHVSGVGSVGSVDAYLFGALESVLGDLGEGLEGDPSDPSDAPRSRTDPYSRARVLVKRVAELAEDRDDYRADLETALRRLEHTEAKLAKTRDELLVAETARAAAASEARADVARQREEEQRAVLAALGLAERRAVRMAAERETLREERDAIAEALAFVKEETRRALFEVNTSSNDAEQEGFFPSRDEASGKARRETETTVATRVDGMRGIEPLTVTGGGWERSRTPKWDRATRVTTPRASRRCWRCPSGTETRRGARPRLARVRERS